MIINKILKINFLLIFIITILCFVGTSALYSAADGSYNPWAGKHLLRFSIFLLGALIISFIDLKIIYKYAYVFFILSLFLLLSVEIIGVLGKGASRWLRIFGFSIQPSEIIKITIILALAKFYNEIKFDKIGNPFLLFFPILIVFIPFFLILIQPDLGTAISLILLGVLIFFAVGIRLWKFLLGLILALISIPILWNYIKPYQKNRIISFLNPDSDPLGQGYQLIQSKIALGSGGFSGKGFLQGTQSYLQYLPEKHTDFIFTLIGEEFGFIGTIFVIFLFIFLISVCYYIGVKAYSVFGRIVCIGFSCNFFIYVIMNISMVSGLMPVVGIPLPLVSYGGTVMLSTMISLGIILNIDINHNIKKFS